MPPTSIRERKRALVDELIERDESYRKQQRERAAVERRELLGSDPTAEQQLAVIDGQLAALGIGDDEIDEMDGEASAYADASRAISRRQQTRANRHFQQLSVHLVDKYRTRPSCMTTRRVNGRARGAGRPRARTGRSCARSGDSGSGESGSDGPGEPGDPDEGQRS